MLKVCRQPAGFWGIFPTGIRNCAKAVIMRALHLSLASFLVIFLFGSSFISTAFAQDAAAADEGPKATTTADPNIDLADLQLRLIPLDKAELQIEVDAWKALVQAKAIAFSAAKLEVNRQNREIAAREIAADAAKDAAKALKKAQETGSADDQKKAMDQLREAQKAGQEAEKTNEVPKTADAPADAGKTVEEKQQEVIDAALENAKETTELADAVDPAAAAAAPDAEEQKRIAEEQAEKKSKVLELLPVLTNERNALIERMKVVLNQYDKLGGDSTEYRRYLATVGGFVAPNWWDLEELAKTALGWLNSDTGGIAWGVGIVKFVAILVAFMFLSRIVGRMVTRAVSMTKNLSELLRTFLINTSKRIVLFVGLLVAVNALGVPMGPFLTVIGAAGFVVAFALQGTLSNFASGMLLLLYRPFDVGDVVDVAGVAGKVKAMTLMSTTLTTPDNKIVVVPNNSIWGSVITNITGSDTRRVDMVFGIGYDDDIAKSQKVLEEVIAGHELILEDPEPVIKVHELADSSVNFVCRPWSKTGDYWAVYWDITRQVKERFDAEGISIPYPQSDVHMHQVVASGGGDNGSGSGNGAADCMKGGADAARK